MIATQASFSKAPVTILDIPHHEDISDLSISHASPQGFPFSNASQLDFKLPIKNFYVSFADAQEIKKQEMSPEFVNAFQDAVEKLAMLVGSLVTFIGIAIFLGGVSEGIGSMMIFGGAVILGGSIIDYFETNYKPTSDQPYGVLK